jgi:hypothetical protein
MLQAKLCRKAMVHKLSGICSSILKAQCYHSIVDLGDLHAPLAATALVGDERIGRQIFQVQVAPQACHSKHVMANVVRVEEGARARVPMLLWAPCRYGFQSL